MKLADTSNFSMREFAVTMSSYEFTTVRRGLIECISGFGVPDYPSRIDLDENTARGLLEALRNVEVAAEITITYPRDTLEALRNALDIAMAEIGPYEWQALTGRDFSDAQTVLAEFDRILAEIEAR